MGASSLRGVGLSATIPFAGPAIQNSIAELNFSLQHLATLYSHIPSEAHIPIPPQFGAGKVSRGVTPVWGKPKCDLQQPFPVCDKAMFICRKQNVLGIGQSDFAGGISPLELVKLDLQEAIRPPKWSNWICRGHSHGSMGQI